MKRSKLIVQALVFLSLVLCGTIVSSDDKQFRQAKVPHEIAPLKAPFDMPHPKRPVFSRRTFDIRKYGAVPLKADGMTNNSKAIAKAIQDCTSAGGGTVLVPAGVWFTGAIHLADNVNLHLAEGAVLRFSTDPEDYLPVVFTRWAGIECYNYSPLIYARDCQNIALTGKGKIEARGKSWWKWVEKQTESALSMYNNQVLKNVPVKKRVHGTPQSGFRPQLFSPINCKNVLAEGITIAEAGPFWTFQFIYCENVILRDVTFITPDGPNTDGANFDSCKNCLIEYCTFKTGDDCIALKSGVNEDGWRVDRPTENIVIRHNRHLGGHAGLAIGSEMSGGVRNVYMHDIEMDGNGDGLRIKSNRGRGSFVENVWIENININRLTGRVIAIDTNYSAWFASNGGKPPLVRNIRVKNLTCRHTSGFAAQLKGLPEKPLENIILENVSISGRHGMQCEHVKQLQMTNVKINTK